MKTDYVTESRRFYALAKTMELLARSLRTQPDRDTVVVIYDLAEITLAQRDRMDKAIDSMIEEGKKASI